MSSYFEMGGYAGYVWPSYAVTFVVLAVVLVLSIRSMRSQERELANLQAMRPARRRPTKAEPNQQESDAP